MISEKNKKERQEFGPLSLENKRILRIFSSLDNKSRGTISENDIWSELFRAGIQKNDPRLAKFKELLSLLRDPNQITLDEFKNIINQTIILKKVLTLQLIIPDFESFARELKEIFLFTKKNTSGKVADYIPQLARVSPDFYAVSVCSLDGQRYDVGDFDESFCLQSTCKPINYCIAHEELGEHKIHNHIGREPSGRSFNEMALNNDGLPHNPLINSGAIMCSSLIRQGLNKADRFDEVLDIWKDLSAGKKPSFNNSVYLSERQTADRNFALSYFMKEKNAFPEKTDIVDTLEFYFQCCSIEVTSKDMAVAAATLANGGVNPLTGKKVFSDNTVKNCLSLMNSCGMYDFSGEFAFKIGFPAKSGVSGALLVVIPNVMGICIWSPRLDSVGNSVRGVDFCRVLSEKYSFHNYDNLVYNESKKDPTKRKYEKKTANLLSLIFAAASGDLDEMHRLEAIGLDLNIADYDGRTAVHLAAAEGQLEVVKFLLDKKININPKDRWGGTPLKDAKKGKHKEVIEFLVANGAE